METDKKYYKTTPTWWRYGQDPMFKGEDMVEVEVEEEPLHDGG